MPPIAASSIIVQRLVGVSFGVPRPFISPSFVQRLRMCFLRYRTTAPHLVEYSQCSGHRACVTTPSTPQDPAQHFGPGFRLRCDITPRTIANTVLFITACIPRCGSGGDDVYSAEPQAVQFS